MNNSNLNPFIRSLQPKANLPPLRQQTTATNAPQKFSLTYLDLLQFDDDTEIKTVKTSTLGSDPYDSYDTEEDSSADEGSDLSIDSMQVDSKPSKKRGDPSAAFGMKKTFIEYTVHGNFIVKGNEIWYILANNTIYFGTRGVMSVIYGKKASYSPVGTQTFAYFFLTNQSTIVIVCHLLKKSSSLEKLLYFARPPSGTTKALVVSCEQVLFLLDQYMSRDKYEANLSEMTELKEKILGIFRSHGITPNYSPDSQDKKDIPRTVKKRKSTGKLEENIDGSHDNRHKIQLSNMQTMKFGGGKIWYGSHQKTLYFNAYGVLEVIYGKSKSPTTLLPAILQNCHADPVSHFALSYLRSGLYVMVLSLVQTCHIIDHFMVKFSGTPNVTSIKQLQEEIAKLNTNKDDSDVEMNEGSFTKEEEGSSFGSSFGSFELKVGDRVMVDWQDVDSKWYPGIVVGIVGDGRYIVEFNGARYNVKKNKIYVSPR